MLQALQMGIEDMGCLRQNVLIFLMAQNSSFSCLVVLFLE